MGRAVVVGVGDEQRAGVQVRERAAALRGGPVV